jgi:hypothetical protein
LMIRCGLQFAHNLLGKNEKNPKTAGWHIERRSRHVVSRGRDQGWNGIGVSSLISRDSCLRFQWLCCCLSIGNGP